MRTRHRSRNARSAPCGRGSIARRRCSRRSFGRAHEGRTRYARYETMTPPAIPKTRSPPGCARLPKTMSSLAPRRASACGSWPKFRPSPRLGAGGRGAFVERGSGDTHRRPRARVADVPAGHDESATPRTRRWSRASWCTEFFPLTYSNVPARGGYVVRMQVPRSALASFGATSFTAADNGSPNVLADVVIGNDGLARAVRFVQVIQIESG